MRVLVNWLASALIIMVAAYILPGVHVENFWTAGYNSDGPGMK